MAFGPQRLVAIPQLSQMMRDKNITYLDLATQAGVDMSTVWRAKRGNKVRVATADLLLQTVKERF